MDRETVITHLQIIHTWAEFARQRDLQFFTPKHLKDIAEWTDDTLELLKEHEAETVESIQMDRSDKWGADLTGYCPSCKRPLKSRFNNRFCGECGQAVKWE